MASFKHNKKRNTGLLQEWFARYIASAILDHRDGDLKQARKILNQAFRPGSELAKEMACFECLYQGKGKYRTHQSAQRLLERVQEACSLQDQDLLDKEKNHLLNEVATKLPGFQAIQGLDVKDFRTHVTIQVMLNHWRAKRTGHGLLEIKMLGDVTLLEEQLLEHLTSGPPPTDSGTSSVMEMSPGDVDHLVVQILTRKVNDRFSNLLPEQKVLVNRWVFKDHEPQHLVETLQKVRGSTIGLIEWSERNEASVFGASLVDRLGAVRKILEEKYTSDRLKRVEELTEEDMEFFLEVCALRGELLGVGH